MPWQELLGAALLQQIQPAVAAGAACFFPLIACELPNVPCSAAPLCLLRAAEVIFASHLRRRSGVSAEDRRLKAAFVPSGVLQPLDSEAAFLLAAWPCPGDVSSLCVPAPSVSSVV